MIAIIKSKFRFFQIQSKFRFRDPIELCKASLGIAPKRRNLINIYMPSTISELIVAIMHPVMLVVSNIYHFILASSAITVNGTFRANYASYNTLKRLCLLLQGIRRGPK
jgi:hypothetical protein